MANNALSSSQVQLPNISDNCMPEGAQIIQLSQIAFDGTGTITYTFQGSSITFKKPSSLRTIYFDARSVAGGDVLMNVQGGPTIRLPLGKQGYIPLFFPTPVVFTLTSAAGNGPLVLYLYNFKVMPIIW